MAVRRPVLKAVSARTVTIAVAGVAALGLVACSSPDDAQPQDTPGSVVTLPSSEGPASSPAPEASPSAPESSNSNQDRDLSKKEVAVSWQEAIETAQKKFSGKPTAVKLEWQRDGLLYTVELVSETEEYEAKIDPETGEIVRDETESLDDDDRREAQEDVFDPADVVDLAKAMDTALAEVDGPITEWSLEGDERGVFFQFDIDDGRGDDDVEVIVDATTGEFVRIDD